MFRLRLGLYLVTAVTTLCVEVSTISQWAFGQYQQEDLGLIPVAVGVGIVASLAWIYCVTMVFVYIRALKGIPGPFITISIRTQEAILALTFSLLLSGSAALMIVKHATSYSYYWKYVLGWQVAPVFAGLSSLLFAGLSVLVFFGPQRRPQHEEGYMGTETPFDAASLPFQVHMDGDQAEIPQRADPMAGNVALGVVCPPKVQSFPGPPTRQVPDQSVIDTLPF